MIENPKKPFVTILGGAKIADKLKVIEKAIEKSNKVILGGGMVYTFLKGMGYEVGKSLVDDSQISYCMDMINKAFLEVMIEGDANGRGFQYPES